MKRLLIIEDDKLLGTVYLKKFSPSGIRVKIAETGKDGLAQVASYRPHALLLDLMLPDMTGIEVLQALRADAGTKDLPVIVFTNSFLPGPIQDARNAGASTVITKADCSATQLVERIAAALGQSDYEPPAGAVETAAPVAAAEVDPRQIFRQHATRLQSALDRLLVISTDMSRMTEVAQAAHAIAGSGAAAGEHTLAWLASALEALIQDLFDKPKHRNPSSTNTIADAARLLISWLQGTTPIPSRRPMDCKILAVDDDPIIGQLVSIALSRAQLRCITQSDPVAALETLRASPFDLVLLDVEMPVMEGPVLCAELRKLPQHQTTPVVFVTAIGEFERRAATLASGGNDLLAKPFLPMELAVKSLTHLLRRLK
ncbi:MAG: response regulator [Verrucomicrobiota bacterium]